MRPDAFELNPANYPYHVELQTRFGDLDVLNHINNVQIAQLFEEGRYRFALDTLNQTSQQRQQQNPMVTVSILTSYLSEVQYPAPVVVSCGMYHFGNTSYTISCLMQQEGRIVAHSRATLVSSNQGKATTLDPEVVARLRDFSVTRDQD